MATYAVTITRLRTEYTTVLIDADTPEKAKDIAAVLHKDGAYDAAWFDGWELGVWLGTEDVKGWQSPFFELDTEILGVEPEPVTPPP